MMFILFFVLIGLSFYWPLNRGTETQRAELPNPGPRIFGAGAPEPVGRPKVEAERAGVPGAR